MVFPPNTKPYGKTFAEWSAEWIKWALTIPMRYNPAADTTGKNCAINQNGPVWFLAGISGGSAERTCVIPAGKAISFPVVLKDALLPKIQILQLNQNCVLAPKKQ
jgi:hypothetical protein